MTHTNPNMPIQTEFPEMMTVPELSQYLRISKPILYGLIREGKFLPHGSDVRFESIVVM